MLCLENALLLVGGGSSLYLTSPSTSPVLAAVELLACPVRPSLPPVPAPVFGSSLHWDGLSSLLSCGGGTWSQTYQDCFKLDLRSSNTRLGEGFFY